MSSSDLLNVSNDASRKPEEFCPKDIEVFVDSEEQNWFKRPHAGKFLGIEDIRTSLNGLEKCEMLARKDIQPKVNQVPRTNKIKQTFSFQKEDFYT